MRTRGRQRRTCYGGARRAPKAAAVIRASVSNRITILRYLLMVLVVCIHNNLNAEDAVYYGLAFSQPGWVLFIKQALSNGIACAAVPLFFMFSGYLFWNKQDAPAYSYAALLKKKARTLFVPYILWTLLYSAFFFIAQSLPVIQNYFINRQNMIRLFSPIEWLDAFWGRIQREGGFPLTYQFWFLRDLMVVFALSPLLVLFIKKLPAVTFAAISVAYICKLPLVVVSSATPLFFFALGCWWAKYGWNADAVDRIRWPELLAAYAGVLVLKFCIPDAPQIANINIAVSAVVLYRLAGAIERSPKWSGVCKKLAAYSFFLYAAHAPVVMATLNKLSYQIIPLRGAWCLVQYIVPTVICIVLCTGVGWLLRRALPRFYTVLTGDR